MREIVKEVSGYVSSPVFCVFVLRAGGLRGSRDAEQREQRQQAGGHRLQLCLHPTNLSVYALCRWNEGCPFLTGIRLDVCSRNEKLMWCLATASRPTNAASSNCCAIARISVLGSWRRSGYVSSKLIPLRFFVAAGSLVCPGWRACDENTDGVADEGVFCVFVARDVWSREEEGR